MNKADVMDIIVKLVKEVDPSVTVEYETNLIDADVVDSIFIMELIAELESAFEIEIDGDEIMPENFESVEAVCAMMERVLC